MKPRILLATLALASALRPRHVAPLRCAQKALGAACAALSEDIGDFEALCAALPDGVSGD